MKCRKIFDINNIKRSNTDQTNTLPEERREKKTKTWKWGSLGQ